MGAGAFATLEHEELSNQVVCGAPGQWRNVDEAVQRRAMADCAGNTLAVAPGRHQGLAGCDAAFWNIGDEALPRVAVEDDLLVLRNLDDAATQRLVATRGMPEALVARADIGLRHVVTFDDAHPLARLQGCEIGSGRTDFIG